MAKATPEQVKALEKAHKQALVNLLQSIRFRYLIYEKFGSKNPDWIKYKDLVYKLGNSWYDRQIKLEKGGATKEGILKNDLWTFEGNKKLKALAKKWDASGEGVGFIPLLIWAVVAIIGFFTADQIVDELNTTTEEQNELIKTSDEICTKYKFNAEECKAFMTEQTTAVTDSGGGGMFSGIFKWVLIGGVAYIVWTNKDKIFSSTKKQ